MTSAAGLTLLRVVPVDGWLHRLDPRTKIAVLLAVVLTVSIKPSWAGLAAVAVAILAAAATGGIPWSARPRLPRIFLLAIGLSLVLGLLAGGEPGVAIGGVTEIGMGGLLAQLRFLAVTFVILAATHLFGWTTSLSELPAAANWYLRPLGRLGLPVDELVTALALGVRALPLLLDEVAAAVRLARRRPRPPVTDPRQRLVGPLVTFVDLASTVTSSTVRRALEVGETLQRRGLDDGGDLGGRPGRGDLIAVVATIGLVVAVVRLPG